MAQLRVREAAQAQGIGINKLSRISDISTNTIRRIWHDPAYDATLSTLQKIATALGVSIHDLIADDPDGDEGKE